MILPYLKMGLMGWIGGSMTYIRLKTSTKWVIKATSCNPFFKKIV